MSLFEVPGWSVPAAPVAQQSKKRKRPPPKEKESLDDIDDAQRIRAAQKNIEKLMQSLGASSDAMDGEEAGRPSKKKRAGKEKKGKGTTPVESESRATERTKKHTESRTNSKEKKTANDQKKSEPVQRPVDKPKVKEQKQKQKQKQKSRRAESVDARSDAESSQGASHVAVSPKVQNTDPTPSKKSRKNSDAAKQPGLTTLQANMKKSLDGARFRLINEMLYKSDSAKAHELMSSDPAVFADYHTGFRHQVESWPTNPVSHYIDVLSSYPAKTVIADLGCGEAALARALVPKGMTVLSFDLVSDGAYVIEADTCTRVPLPGSEKPLDESTNGNEEEGEGQVVDVVVCALSLMGTNWPGCIREAWRILKSGGEFKVAEVASRFTSVEDFTTFISAFGFKLKSKDDRNTHFTLFEFKKVPRKPKSEKEWQKLMSRGSILKPCEYKRR
ncbi:methyltransferase-domain-containing protein [Trametes polyzona]|nr:methyltransferase-domain-containing protein [Trametes polyzona]